MAQEHNEQTLSVYEEINSGQPRSDIPRKTIPMETWKLGQGV